MIADLSREKLTLQRSKNSVLLYGFSCLSTINEASLLKTTVAVDPIRLWLRKLMAKRNQTQFPEPGIRFITKACTYLCPVREGYVSLSC